MVGIDAITRSVQVHWSSQYSACATVHPGQEIDTSAEPAWVELCVEAWDEEPRRNDAPERGVAVVTVHCFSRDATATAAVSGVVDAARAALARRLIPVRDYEQSGAPLIGQLRMRETELRDLTRAHDDALRGTLRHVVVLCRGVVEST